MKIKTLLIVSAIGIALATPESLQAQANPKPVKPVKPDVGDVKDDAKEGGKERPKFDVAKIKERLKAAFDKRKKKRGDAKKKGLKGLRTEWVENMKGNREEVRARLKEIREEFKNKRDEVIDANDDGDDGGE